LSVIDDIVRDSREQLAEKARLIPLERVKRVALDAGQPLDLAAALSHPGLNLIAEVKRASPSRGLIVPDFDPVGIARAFAGCGVAAISVLTETNYFQGSPEYLKMIGEALGPKRPPLLRKDFIYDPYQIYESRAIGADALLLIAAILPADLLAASLALTHELGMQALVEVHNEVEAEIALNSGARIIGINNRDLRTFAVDLQTTARLRQLIPPDRLVVSESGIKNRADVENLSKLGINAILVGESLLTSGNICQRIKELI
jgi:indole-3-glycerol phosphate synthase